MTVSEAFDNNTILQRFSPRAAPAPPEAVLHRPSQEEFTDLAAAGSGNLIPVVREILAERLATLTQRVT